MSSSIFHQGDLQSGIASAIQQRKLVACFVRSDNSTSKQWEEEWLASTSTSDSKTIGEKIADKVVLLRIELGSQEAGFLGHFCPLDEAPVLVVIRDGQVLDKIEGGVEEEEFAQRVAAVCGIGSDGATTAAQSAATGTGEATEEANSGATPLESSQPPQNPTDPKVRSMLEDRARRLEADRLRREAAAKADRQAREEARRKDSESVTNSDKGKQRATSEQAQQSKARDAWLVQQKQRKDDAKKEKARILSQIEADKQERKMRAESTKEKEKMGGQFSEMRDTSTSTSKPPKSTAGASSKTCALQIRLFDGSSLRSSFDSAATLTSAVRPWIKDASPADSPDIPFTFRHIQPPSPSRSIELGEEHLSLQELGLTPNATLVLVPVGGAVDAYNSSSGGAINTVLNAPLWLASSAFSAAGSILGALNVFSAPAPAADTSGTGQDAAGRSLGKEGEDEGRDGDAKMRVKTFADQRDERRKRGQGTEFYNGNSSAFEGRKDDEDRKKD